MTKIKLQEWLNMPVTKQLVAGLATVVLCLAGVTTFLFLSLTAAKNDEIKKLEKRVEMLEERNNKKNADFAEMVRYKDSIINAKDEGRYKSLLDVVNIQKSKSKVEIKNPEQ